MTNVGYNAPHYGYGSGIPPQPVPMPMPASDDPAPPVASYDVDPSSGHAPPLVVQQAAPPPTEAISFVKDDEPEPEPAAPTSPASSGRVAVQVVDRLRSTAERGTTTVPTPVIEKIATLAVREVPGVHEFATGETGDTGDKPLAIGLDGKTATIEIHLVIEYGFAVHSVTEKVRTKVISALENLFSLDVTAVDIVIDDIHLADAEPGVE